MSTLVSRGAGRPGTLWRRRLTPYTFVLPALTGLGLFLIYPLLSAAYFSFTNIRLETLTDPPQFVGWNNWRFLVEDIRLGKAIENTLWLVVVMVPARMLGALLTALFLNQVKRGRGVYRTIFYLPALAPPVAATIAFVLLLKPGTGPVNTLLAKLGVSSPPLWFNDPDWAKPSLVFLALWGIGDLLIIFVAALLDVPVELHEAAALDGANAWQRFRYVHAAVLHAGRSGGERRFRIGHRGRRDHRRVRLPQRFHLHLPTSALYGRFRDRCSRLRQRAFARALRSFAGRDTTFAATIPDLPMRNKRKVFLLFIARHAVATALSFMFLAPVAFLVLTSFMSSDQTLTSQIWPRDWHPANYVEAFNKAPLGRYLREHDSLCRIGHRIHVAGKRARRLWPGQAALARPQPDDGLDHLHDDAAASGHHRAALPSLGEQWADRIAVAADPADAGR